tara:strand:- start:455 stop:625 length:171 start_codon:yes stop_codon:yes gene_type:complete
MRFKHLNNQQLIDRINYLYEHNKNDDDEIAEMCRRRNEQGFETKVVGEKFIIINKG